MQISFDFGGAWVPTRDGCATGMSLFRDHYSFRPRMAGPSSGLFVGPGEKMVLVSPAADALFVWRKFLNDDGQTGVNCAVFRNTGPRRSSELILEAEALAHERWPGERFYTYVNPRKVRSANPGYCFKMAGWALVGITKRRKYLILAK